MKENADFIVAGAGIVGIATAIEIKTRYPDQSVLVLEKESEPGYHASGRNSGVLHAGFYYTSDSLKAKFTREGNRRLSEYCLQNKLKFRACGKLVVATRADQVETLDLLLDRGKKNQVDVRLVDRKEAAEIEPRAKLFGDRALYSPTTASADPVEVLSFLVKNARQLGIQLKFSEEVIGQSGVTQGGRDFQIKTCRNRYGAGYFVNCAGLQADRIARMFDVGSKYRILPYRGLYLYSNEPAESFRAHVYPVPDLRQPFLGVHVTLGVNGKHKIGPTAIPGFWREQYSGLSRFRIDEFLEVCWRNLGLLVTGGRVFRDLAREEIQNLARKKIVSRASLLAEGLTPDQFRTWGRAGIRAQLFDVNERKLVTDFVVERSERSLHVLNAVSPGWTCSLPFSEYLVDQMAIRPVERSDSPNLSGHSGPQLS